ncbi:IS1182 family transposase [Leptothoe sp. LEGE 181152]|nr:IS1182 family transposase [Leptothoe sp. LEGE 181152]
MSLKPQPESPVPADTLRVAKAVFAKGNPYVTLHDELGPIFEDTDFSELFSKVGQSAIPPWRLALVTIMQFRENLSDRQAAEAVRSRIDWKYLLRLELTDIGFNYSVLSEFRDRLIAGNVEHLLLDKLLVRCGELGLVKAGGKQRTDSTRVLGAIRSLNRLEVVGETLRAALNDLAVLAPDWLQQIAPEDWYQRYGRRIEDYRLPSKPAERIAYAQQVGEDGAYLLKCLSESKLSAEGQALKTVQALEELWPYHYEYNHQEDGPSLRWKSDKQLTKKTPTVESPYDTDVRYRRRCGTTWTGYITHLSETCDDDSCHLITHVMTTDASVHEAQCVDDIHQALIDKHLRPEEHFADTAYINAFLLVNAQNQNIEMIGPARFDTSWQTRTEGAFNLDYFKIDWDNEQVTCPEGKISQAWKTYNRDSGKPYILARFDPQDCVGCPVRSLCTKAKPTVGRTLHLLPQDEHKALEKARSIQTTTEGQERYRRRAGIEGTIAQGVNSCGLRRSRYMGMAKTHLQNMAIGAAVNIDRLFNWFQEVPLAKTRVSRFKALEPAA